MRRILGLTIALAAMMALAVPASAGGKGATQISGVGFVPDAGQCESPPLGVTPTYAILMTGDLEGCVYGFNPEFKIGPSGVAKERADEIFVSFNDDGDTFRMRENWHAKFDPASGTQIFGFCKHPIVKGSGKGDFVGVSGRLDFRDDLTDPANPRFIYKGHLKNLD